jgi:hypothetical protein
MTNTLTHATGIPHFDIISAPREQLAYIRNKLCLPTDGEGQSLTQCFTRGREPSSPFVFIRGQFPHVDCSWYGLVMETHPFHDVSLGAEQDRLYFT